MILLMLHCNHLEFGRDVIQCFSTGNIYHYPLHFALFFSDVPLLNVLTIVNQKEWTRNILSQSETRPGLWWLMVLDWLCAVDAPAPPTHYTIWAHTPKWLNRFTSYTSSSREINMKASGFTQMHRQKEMMKPTHTNNLNQMSSKQQWIII